MRNSGISSECLDYNAPEHSVTGAQLSLFGCHGQGGNQVLSLLLSLRLSEQAETCICKDGRSLKADVEVRQLELENHG